MRELSGVNPGQPGPWTWCRLLRRAPGSLRFAESADRCRRAGALAQAAAVCARGLLRYPSYATGHVVMGEIFCARELLHKAREQWQEALRLDPQHPRAHFRLAELHLAQGERDEAVGALEAAILSDSNFAEAHFLLAEIRGGAAHGSADAGPGVATPSADRPHASTPSYRFSLLLSTLERSPFLQGVLLSDANGLPIAGNPTWGSASSAAGPQMAAAVSAAAARESKQLLSCLGAGDLKSVLLRGAGGVIRYVALPGATLIAELKPDAPLGAADAEITEALSKSEVCEGSDEQVDRFLAA